MKCVIPCAGESSRMNFVPKHLIRVGNKPLLLHIIDTWRDQVDSFVFVLRRSATYLWEYLPKNSVIVFQDEPRGLADAILKAEPCIKDKFVVTLGDCLYEGKFDNKEFELGIGVWRTDDEEEIRKNYLVWTLDGLVKSVVEKPVVIGCRNCGMGTYFLDTRIFNFIRELLPMVKPGGGDFTDILQGMIDAGERITPIWFEGKYINVTHPGDIERAEKIFGGYVPK